MFSYLSCFFYFFIIPEKSSADKTHFPAIRRRQKAALSVILDYFPRMSYGFCDEHAAEICIVLRSV